MPNNTRTHADGTYVDGYQPPKTDFEDLDRKIHGSWNGDKGGAYCAPAGGSGSAYDFGGDGLLVTGPTRLTYGGSIKGGSACFKIRTGRFPQLAEGHGSRSRSIVQPIQSYTTNHRHLWSRQHPYAGVGSVALASRGTFSRKVETPDLYVPLRVIDGAVMTKVDIHFRVASRRVYAPIAMPKLRIVRVNKDSVTNAPEPLKSTTDGTGYDFAPLVTTPSDWYLEGAVQTFSYVCDQNNTIDVENYTYWAQLVEEQGVVTPDDEFDGVRFVERKADCLIVVPSSQTLTGSITSEGTASGTGGARILVVDPDSVLDTGETNSDSAKNGIWITAAGAWSRATDLDEQADFTPNWIVRVTNGVVNGSVLWQCESPANKQKIELSTGAASDVKAQPRIVPAEPKGNIYHSLVPFFELTDLRFQ